MDKRMDELMSIGIYSVTQKEKEIFESH